jgi:spore photoproduct lyase
MQENLRVSIVTKEYELLDGSKKVLVQQVGDGSIIKRFEKTPIPIKPIDVVCPHFLELKWAYGCPYDCSWCYLKGTLRLLETKTKPVVKDYKKIESHVKQFLNSWHYSNEILNTGELADSLMWENVTNPFSKFIIPIFENQNKHKILFLTKSNNIKNLLNTSPQNQVIVSFSLNADEVAKIWEKWAPTIEERIEAARKISEYGYETRIRIDPMVPIEGWQKHYPNLIDQIFSKFVPERITLGSLRGLQTTIKECKDRSWLKFLSETSGWGKKIAFDTRYEMYLTIINYLKEKHDYNKIALCKETLSMWEKLKMDWRECRCNCVW